MKPILLLGLLGCMLIDVAMSKSRSRSCTMVNGEWHCEEMNNDQGNFAGSSSSAVSGPGGSQTDRSVATGSGFGDSSKYHSYSSRTESGPNPPGNTWSSSSSGSGSYAPGSGSYAPGSGSGSGSYASGSGSYASGSSSYSSSGSNPYPSGSSSYSSSGSNPYPSGSSSFSSSGSYPYASGSSSYASSGSNSYASSGSSDIPNFQFPPMMSNDLGQPWGFGSMAFAGAFPPMPDYMFKKKRK